MSTLERAVNARANELVRYELRVIQITQWSKHDDGGKRRKGANVDRKWIAEEMGRGTAFVIEDEDGDNYSEFAQRARGRLVHELNAICAEGWRLVQFVPHHSFSWEWWPLGTYIFSRP